MGYTFLPHGPGTRENSVRCIITAERDNYMENYEYQPGLPCCRRRSQSVLCSFIGFSPAFNFFGVFLVDVRVLWVLDSIKPGVSRLPSDDLDTINVVI